PGETLQVVVTQGRDGDERVYTGSAATKQRRGEGSCVDRSTPIITYYKDEGQTYSSTRYASYPASRRPKSRYIDVAIDGQHQNRTYW
nr:hypothetical protein [Kiritimatiellia bacterium]